MDKLTCVLNHCNIKSQDMIYDNWFLWSKSDHKIHLIFRSCVSNISKNAPCVNFLTISFWKTVVYLHPVV